MMAQSRRPRDIGIREEAGNGGNARKEQNHDDRPFHRAAGTLWLSGLRCLRCTALGTLTGLRVQHGTTFFAEVPFFALFALVVL